MPITRSRTDLIDNGTFGQALVLSAFNYAKAYNEGIEFHAKYNSGNFQAYANVAVAQQRASEAVSNQYLFDNTTPLATLGGLTEFQYLQTHFIYTDHNQFVTASAGASYHVLRPAGDRQRKPSIRLSWCGTKLSADVIYGSGLRNGDANIGTVPAYTQVNVGIKREFLLPNDPKPMTVRFDVVNLFDTIYEIRDGSRHRRVRAAVRAAPRLLPRHLEKDMRGHRKVRPPGPSVDPVASSAVGLCGARLERGRGAGPSARLGYRGERTDLCAERLGYGDPSRLDLRRHVLDLCAAGHRDAKRKASIPGKNWRRWRRPIWNR